ncbi:MAG: AraC family transcriptional regulator [Phenylobacterium sp.]|nr:AraC family transcriptional regulator [Phenylobacterium sp.]
MAAFCREASVNASVAVRASAGAYGRNLAQRFGAEDAPFIVTRCLRRGEMAVTELRVDQPTGRPCDPFAPEDAYLIGLLLREFPDHCYWVSGQQVPVASLRAGEITIHDLRRDPLVLIDKPMHSLLLHLPRTALDALADGANVPRVTDLRYDPGVGVADETVRNIGLSLLPAVRAPDQVSRLFMDHLTLALGAHVAQTYGGMQARSRPIQGGLAGWQEKRSKEMLASDLTGAMPVSDLALACGLSVSHFSRAFRRSTGLAPHAWLLHTRVDAAKAMLRQHEASLSMIALACGFADQSHFTRVFTRRVGLSPGAWRKYLSG